MQNQKNFKNPEVTLSSENKLDNTRKALNEVEISKNKIDKNHVWREKHYPYPPYLTKSRNIERSYFCSYCARKFKNSQNMKIHERVHSTYKHKAFHLYELFHEFSYCVSA